MNSQQVQIEKTPPPPLRLEIRERKEPPGATFERLAEPPGLGLGRLEIQAEGSALIWTGNYHNQPLFWFHGFRETTQWGGNSSVGVRSHKRYQDRLLCGLQELRALTVCQGSRLGVFSLQNFTSESRLTDSAQVEERQDEPLMSCRRDEPHFLPLLLFCSLYF